MKHRNDFVTHFESALDGTHLEPRLENGLHRGRPVWVRYDLEAAGAALSRETLAGRPTNLWRYREILPLPLDREPLTLEESCTPLIQADRLAREIGLEKLWIKSSSGKASGSARATAW